MEKEEQEKDKGSSKGGEGVGGLEVSLSTENILKNSR